MEFPQVFFVEADEGESGAAAILAGTLTELEVRTPLVTVSRHAEGLATGLPGPRADAIDAGAADQDAAVALGRRAREAGADAIVAIGGGRRLDVAKLAAARAGLIVIAVPTQLSHDGICSPVAVVPNTTGRTESLGAVAPRAVVVPIPTLARAPAASSAAGIGDLLANPLALRDWALAAERRLEDVDQRAWDLSVGSYEAIAPYLDRDPGSAARDPAFLHTLADALVLSGMAMICSGTSRPASGAEHEISHALDELFGGRAMHGAQVAFGCLVSAALYDEDTAAFGRRLETLGLPAKPANLGLSRDDMVAVLLAAPDTRPGRFTVLEDAQLDDASARALVDRIWGDT